MIHNLDDLPKNKRRLPAIESEILFQERGASDSFSLCPYCREGNSRAGRGCLKCWGRYRILAVKEAKEVAREREA